MIHILMATYNGEKYIKDQIESILCQDYPDIRLFINDDCSSDGTEKIVLEYIKRHPNKIVYHRNRKNSGGAKSNFMKMLLDYGKLNCDYIMFCDQDDVWYPNKVSLSLDSMKKMEKEYGENIPLLVHTDLTVVDENLHCISKSHEKYAKIKCKRNTLNNLLVQNIVTGCTIIMNKALAKKIKPPSTYYVMHDWYIALVAGCFGHIAYVDKPTIYYRQHSSNTLGISHNGFLKTVTIKISDIIKNKDNDNTYLQAQSFFDEYKNCLNSDEYSLLLKYTTISEKKKLNRIFILNKYNFYKYGLMRKILQIIHV